MKTHTFKVVVWLVAGFAAAAASGAEKAVVRIRGSNTFGEELGPQLIEAYGKQNPDVTFELGTKGSGAGMRALLDGECDIASTSRVANEDETRLAKAKGVRLSSHFLGYYGVAVIVNARNKVRSLTHAQVRDIFTGAVRNWSEVGGDDAPIKVYVRDPVSGTYLGFQELAMDNGPYVDDAVELKSYPEIGKVISDDRNGIGYSGMTLSHGKAVRGLRINGIPANAASVSEGLYPYARGLRFYTISKQESGAALAFIRFVRGREGQGIMEKNGYVPRMLPRMDVGMPGY